MGKASKDTIFVFVHGALDPSFRRRYPLKLPKKVLYWAFVEYRVLRDAAAVFYGCEEERRLARTSFLPYRATDDVLPLGVAAPKADVLALRDAFLRARIHLRGKRILLFLGRLHPIKGCDLLIEAFSLVSREDDRLHLVMAGPDRDGWRDKLEHLSRSRGLSGRITWAGMLRGDEKWGAYCAAEVLGAALPL